MTLLGFSHIMTKSIAMILRDRINLKCQIRKITTLGLEEPILLVGTMRNVKVQATTNSTSAAATIIRKETKQKTRHHFLLQNQTRSNHCAVV